VAAVYSLAAPMCSPKGAEMAYRIFLMVWNWIDDIAGWMSADQLVLVLILLADAIGICIAA
jgi:hypothetical protein